MFLCHRKGKATPTGHAKSPMAHLAGEDTERLKRDTLICPRSHSPGETGQFRDRKDCLEQSPSLLRPLHHPVPQDSAVTLAWASEDCDRYMQDWVPASSRKPEHPIEAPAVPRDYWEPGQTAKKESGLLPCGVPWSWRQDLAPIGHG